MEQNEFPLPELDTINQNFFESASNGNLLLQRCKKCGNIQFYPRPLCTKCGSLELEWIKSSGKGKIYSYTAINRVINNSKVFEKNIPYTIAIIELSEGIRVYGLIKDCSPSKIRIGQEATFSPMIVQNLGLPAFEVEECKG